MSIKEATQPSLYCSGKPRIFDDVAMSHISEALTSDHRHGKEMFAAAVQAVERGDWAGCHERFDAFLRALKHHVAIEEQLLFPAFEQATGIAAGPTQVMRNEHREMLLSLEGIAAVIAEQDAGRFRGLAQSITVLMDSHNAKEENVLYPMCDEALPEPSGEKLLEMIAQR